MSAPERPVLSARGRGGGRALTITLAASIGLHIAAGLAILLLPRGGVLVDGPEKPIEVELVMEEHKGDQHAAPPQEPGAQKAPDSTVEPTEAAKQLEETHSEETPRSPAPSPVEAKPDAPKETVEPVKQSVPAAAAPKQPEPAPKPSQSVPTITLSGTDSPSDARAWGDRIIPAAPDAVFHNRPPEYPRAAAENGEHGTVVLLIHVSSSGTTAGVDVVRSSGYALLDHAAREAVTRWRFLPAVKDGQTVASDMQMGFIFDYE